MIQALTRSNRHWSKGQIRVTLVVQALHFNAASQGGPGARVGPKATGSTDPNNWQSHSIHAAEYQPDVRFFFNMHINMESVPRNAWYFF